MPILFARWFKMGVPRLEEKRCPPDRLRGLRLSAGIQITPREDPMGTRRGYIDGAIESCRTGGHEMEAV
ncbi:hypothetical protein Misp01_31470 [Microtetraspora sp. NBRC 13810]|nr:hypothetical protein Misp01_31470 [Microtetraspora sp. NBRC 13810]